MRLEHARSVRYNDRAIELDAHGIVADVDSLRVLYGGGNAIGVFASPDGAHIAILIDVDGIVTVVADETVAYAWAQRGKAKVVAGAVSDSGHMVFATDDSRIHVLKDGLFRSKPFENVYDVTLADSRHTLCVTDTAGVAHCPEKLCSI